MLASCHAIYRSFVKSLSNLVVGFPCSVRDNDIVISIDKSLFNEAS